jgi:hypothetical protein
VNNIKLNGGFVAVVDEEDYEWLNKYTWKVANKFCEANRYVITIVELDGKQKTILMHRMIMKPSDGVYVDHINGNKLDNRRCNLRLCTIAENNLNKRGSSYKKSSKYKGVYKCTQTTWLACIVHNKKQHNIGFFKNEIEAAKAYNVAAIKYHGEFARLNEI